MSVKEKPLFDAVERLGPLPGFLTDNPIIGGFFTMIMCAVFGAALFFVPSLMAGGGEAIYVYLTLLTGSFIGVFLGSLMFIVIAASAVIHPEEAKVRLLFFLGGVLGLVTLIIFGVLGTVLIYEKLISLGRIV